MGGGEKYRDKQRLKCTKLWCFFSRDHMMGAAGPGNNNQTANTVFHVEKKSCHLFEKCVIQGQQIESANKQRPAFISIQLRIWAISAHILQ